MTTCDIKFLDWLHRIETTQQHRFQISIVSVMLRQKFQNFGVHAWLVLDLGVALDQILGFSSETVHECLKLFIFWGVLVARVGLKPVEKVFKLGLALVPVELLRWSQRDFVVLLVRIKVGTTRIVRTWCTFLGMSEGIF